MACVLRCHVFIFDSMEFFLDMVANVSCQVPLLYMWGDNPVNTMTNKFIHILIF